MHKLFTLLAANDLSGIKEIIEYVDLNEIKDLKGRSLFYCACISQNKEIINLLLEYHCDVNLLNNLDESILFEMCRSGNLELIKLLLNHGAKVNMTNKKGETPLHLAAHNGNKEIYELLLCAGASEKVLTNNKLNVIHYAILGGHEELVYQLYEKIGTHADKDVHNLTYLHYAARSNINIFNYFYKRISDINIFDSMCRTPIFYAVRQGNLFMVEHLVKYGAYLQIKDRNYETILNVAKIHNLDQISDYLENIINSPKYRQLEVSDGLIIAVLNRDYFLVSQLLAADMKVNYKNKSGFTAIDYAKKYHFDTILNLLKSYL